MRRNKEFFEREFVCPKCRARGANVEEVSIGGAVARMLPFKPHDYLSVTCGLCGYTEFYQLAVLAREEQPIPPSAKLAEKPE